MDAWERTSVLYKVKNWVLALVRLVFGYSVGLSGGTGHRGVLRYIVGLLLLLITVILCYYPPSLSPLSSSHFRVNDVFALGEIWGWEGLLCMVIRTGPRNLTGMRYWN